LRTARPHAGAHGKLLLLALTLLLLLELHGAKKALVLILKPLFERRGVHGNSLEERHELLCRELLVLPEPNASLGRYPRPVWQLREYSPKYPIVDGSRQP